MISLPAFVFPHQLGWLYLVLRLFSHHGQSLASKAQLFVSNINVSNDYIHHVFEGSLPSCVQSCLVTHHLGNDLSDQLKRESRESGLLTPQITFFLWITHPCKLEFMHFLPVFLSQSFDKTLFGCALCLHREPLHQMIALVVRQNNNNTLNWCYTMLNI